jgi:hypothetical protein
MRGSNHPVFASAVFCDWCNAAVTGPGVPECMEIVIVRLQDGSLEPEAWCPECQEAAFSHGALS